MITSYDDSNGPTQAVIHYDYEIDPDFSKPLIPVDKWLVRFGDDDGLLDVETFGTLLAHKVGVSLVQLSAVGTTVVEPALNSIYTY
ncbi:hypothetical protein SEA_REFUGE_10 [Mycobacterium phage Refuge]|uniref:Uncharacterized protein n=1 Tax=Mycobacterium phage Refuge TaxID=2517967 RepID=A0A482JBR1_9CAUD|nr:hypothetical protein KIV61_gp10 [Mycobacterium phage Refuge]QBP31033.1 hypothetical protein SEA_REFUGE_10 [Mycobacterium phage Refuge]